MSDLIPRMEVVAVCPECAGKKTCPTCKGVGEVTVRPAYPAMLSALAWQCERLRAQVPGLTPSTVRGLASAFRTAGELLLAAVLEDLAAELGKDKP